MGLEMEDDVLYADISKQIAELIMDDDEDDHVVFPVQTPQFHFQGFHHMPVSMIAPPYAHEMAFSHRRRECKGTGVFIPRSSSLPFTRKNKRPANKKKKNKSNSTTNNNPQIR